MSRNPLELKRNTHILAREHLRRFTHDENKSQLFVYSRRKGLVMPTSVDVDGLFSVHGVWSHRAENLMERIEGAFWPVINEVVASGRIANSDVISEYFALWYARAYYSENYKKFAGPLNGIEPLSLKEKVDVVKRGKVVKATKEDLLESRGAGFFSTDFEASARSTSWAIIRVLMDKCLLSLGEIRWGIVECLEGSLVLPDRMIYRDLPIGPRLILHGYTRAEKYHSYARVSRVDVDDWNRGFFRGARHAIAAQSRETLDALMREATST